MEPQVGRFRIISPLGSGGFGEAFRAWDTERGVPVVLKRPLQRHLQRPDVLARFDREINRLLELTHPHIVPILAHGHDSTGLPYLAMQFLPAGSLADRKKPHPFSFLHRWLPSVAAALDYVHARGIVHRDVKPANIFFDTESQAYLGDFGIAKVIDEDLAQESEHSLTSTGGEIGTYPYMGPEFFHKPRVLSGAYDQYALAVSVYEMICGRRPFSGDSGQLVVAHVTQAPPDVRRFSPDAPASLCDAIMRALDKDPGRRFRTCVEFAEAALQDIGVVSRDGSVRRFLCPGCHNLVKVPTELSGRSCRCPDCSARLRVSEKLDALWLREEDPSGIDARTPHERGSVSERSLVPARSSGVDLDTAYDVSLQGADASSPLREMGRKADASLDRIALALDARLSRQNGAGCLMVLLTAGTSFVALWRGVGSTWWFAALWSLGAMFVALALFTAVKQLTVAHAVAQVARAVPSIDDPRAELRRLLSRMQDEALVTDAASEALKLPAATIASLFVVIFVMLVVVFFVWNQEVQWWIGNLLPRHWR